MKCPRCGERELTKDGKTPAGKQRWSCSKQVNGRNSKKDYCYSTTDPNATVPRDQSGGGLTQSGVLRPAKFNKALKGVQRVIVTAAQNGTPIHEGFLASLKTMAKELDAELVIIPLRYKNPTSRWSQSQENAEVWDPAVMPYLCNYRKRLNPNLMLLGDVKVQPTAGRPLIGFEGLTGHESAILGHPKLQFLTVPAPANKLPKILTTTGAVTVSNHTDSRAGKQADFHHTLAATLVEICGKTFHLRQLMAGADGSFTDLDRHYSPSGVSKAPPAAALIFGDTHVDAIDPTVDRAQHGPGGMVEVLRPQALVYHDLLDGMSCNPHTAANPFVAVGLRQRGLDDVRAEVNRAIQYVVDRAKKGMLNVLVPSNHGDFIQRWMMTDWRTQPQNAEMYLETALAFVRNAATSEPERFDAFGYWAKRLTEGRTDMRVLSRDESFTAGGIELGLHGDEGANGMRGSRLNLRRIGVKTVIGHSHSPGVEEGAWQVGTSSKLRLGYNTGPSSWLHTSCAIYASQKRCLLTVVGGEWRL